MTYLELTEEYEKIKTMRDKFDAAKYAHILSDIDVLLNRLSERIVAQWIEENESQNQGPLSCHGWLTGGIGKINYIQKSLIVQIEFFNL